VHRYYPVISSRSYLKNINQLNYRHINVRGSAYGAYRFSAMVAIANIKKTVEMFGKKFN
jgi:hypothetical protein